MGSANQNTNSNPNENKPSNPSTNERSSGSPSSAQNNEEDKVLRQVFLADFARSERPAVATERTFQGWRGNDKGDDNYGDGERILKEGVEKK
jgi:hypothetical protein